MNMRVALCISGQMRTYRECYPALKEHVLDVLAPDLFIHTWSNSGHTTNVQSILPQGAAADDFRIQEEQITDQSLQALYAPVSAVVETCPSGISDEHAGVRVPELLKQHEPKWYKGAIPMYYKMKMCNELKCRHEQQHGFRYDRVIRMRPDLMFGEPIPTEVLQSTDALRYETGGGDPQFQFNDKFALGTSEMMDYYCSVWDHLDQYWREPLGDGAPENHRVGERLMMHHMRQAPFATRIFEMEVRLHRESPVPRKAGLMARMKSWISGSRTQR